MIEQLFNRINEFDGCILDGNNFCLEVINGVDFFVDLIEVLSRLDLADGHECEMLVIVCFEWEESEMFLIVFLDGLGDAVGVEVERRQFLKIPQDFIEFSIWSGFDDVLLYLFLLLRHPIEKS